jgi:hypothetical protein
MNNKLNLLNEIQPSSQLINVSNNFEVLYFENQYFG